MIHWPHAPPHLLSEQGAYIVTAGTYLKAHFFQTSDRLDFLQNTLFTLAKAAGWEMHAWAFFSNHYHFVAHSPKDPSHLSKWLAEVHFITAKEVNRLDGTPNRQVWYQFWDSRITIQPSYLARLNYVHRNPVKHGLVKDAAQYPWCSAARFEREASRSFVKSVYSFDYSKVKVADEF